jgi:hypothetical protein
MVSVAIQPYMLSDIMPSVIIASVVILNILAPFKKTDILEETFENMKNLLVLSRCLFSSLHDKTEPH